jgi:hypothetical protein
VTDDTQFSIEVDEGYIATANSQCWMCHADIAVVGIYIRMGKVDGELRSDFIVSKILRIDPALRAILKPLSFFREGHGHTAETIYIGNHCFECGKLQGDFYLHSARGGAFNLETPEDLKSIDFVPIGGSF